MYKKRLRLLSHVYIGIWVRKPLLWAVHRSFSMQYGLYKDVLFPVPTHSETFLCFHCFFIPPNLVCSPFCLLSSYCCCVLLLSLASLQDVAELGLQPLHRWVMSPSYSSLQHWPKHWASLDRSQHTQWPHAGEVGGSAFSLCQQYLTHPEFYSTDI